MQASVSLSGDKGPLTCKAWVGTHVQASVIDIEESTGCRTDAVPYKLRLFLARVTRMKMGSSVLAGSKPRLTFGVRVTESAWRDIGKRCCFYVRCIPRSVVVGCFREHEVRAWDDVIERARVRVLQR
jgi:hypothetical protein